GKDEVLIFINEGRPCSFIAFSAFSNQTFIGPGDFGLLFYQGRAPLPDPPPVRKYNCSTFHKVFGSSIAGLKLAKSFLAPTKTLGVARKTNGRFCAMICCA